MKELLKQLDKAFENRLRLGIMSALVVNASLDFNALKEVVGATDGNLATHLKALERAGYIGVRKGYVGRKPNTRYSATKIGQRAFDQHLSVLEKIIRTRD